MPKITPAELEKMRNLFAQVYMDGIAANLTEEEIARWTVDDYFEAIEENYVDWDSEFSDRKI